MSEFYYDQLMNDDRSTFSVYLFNKDGENLRGDRSYKGENVTELLRGLISQDPTMSTQVVWNGSPLNLTSAWANLTSNLKSASRNLRNAANNIQGGVKSIETITTGGKSGQILDWNQDAFYSVNEFQKTFGGMTTSTPLAINSLVLPYISSDPKKGYQSVIDQLTLFLGAMYPTESTNTEERNTFKSTVEEANKSEGSGGFFGFLKDLVNAIPNLLNWGAAQLDALTNDVLSGNNYVLTLKPPHGYRGVPIDFIEDQWMSNTLAIRIGTRQLYNLLISTISITVSKEMTLYNGKLSPTSAQVNLSFVPVLVLKPSEISEYVLDNLQPSNTVTESPKQKIDPKSITPYYKEDEFE